MSVELGSLGRFLGSYFIIQILEVLTSIQISLILTLIFCLVATRASLVFQGSESGRNIIPMMNVQSKPVNPHGQLIEGEIIKGSYSEFKITSGEITAYRR